MQHIRIDRYPAKMVSHFAERLIDRYTDKSASVLDPFCGSGAVLHAGKRRGLRIAGIDINPYAVLMARTKLLGFDGKQARRLCTSLLSKTERTSRVFPVAWDAKDYWFTPCTLNKFERLRFAARDLALPASPEGEAVLLAMALSVRPCSRADQRSPKPFISKSARRERGGRHFDPLETLLRTLDILVDAYGGERYLRCTIECADIREEQRTLKSLGGTVSHVITSPPYANAQDYFRNSKLELYMLEGLLPIIVEKLMHRFIGSERRPARHLLTSDGADERRRICPGLPRLEKENRTLAAVMHRYLTDMNAACSTIHSCVADGGVVVMVCGDNLVGGVRIPTWRVVRDMWLAKGAVLFDSWKDAIACRVLAPRRLGHRGLIKEEVVMAFRVES